MYFEHDKVCQTCKHYYIEFGTKGNVMTDGCDLETQIPFFDRDNYIGCVQTDCCDKWEAQDGWAEE